MLRWRPGCGGAGKSFARSVPDRGATLEATSKRCPAISKVISRITSVLEIHLETTSALPDKADKPKRSLVSKSPKIFCFRRHGNDGARLDRRYA
ncbi:hypothetical protein X979_5910 [Burkholderia pseudomallei MSHR7527]|nr:hypothetical protein X979_5910 [Burkholderia pseudomallei MSHR7527]